MSTTVDVRRGEGAFFSFKSEVTGCELVFEDDGESGYLYALTMEQSIEEAVFLYKTEDHEAFPAEALTVEWSKDEWKARVQLDGKLVAIFNYRSRLLFSASSYPAPSAWSSASRTEAEATFSVHQ